MRILVVLSSLNIVYLATCLVEYNKHSIKAPWRVLLLIRKIGSNSQAIILCGVRGGYLYRNISTGWIILQILEHATYLYRLIGREYPSV